MRFTFRPLTGADVASLLAWRYDPPYDEYDPAHDPSDVAELRAAVGSSTWFAVDDADADTPDRAGPVGFLDCRPDNANGEVEIGLGLRPDHVGRGLGRSFVDAVVALIRERWEPRTVTLDVLPWNARAIAVYERAAFVRGEIYDRAFEDGNVVTFLRMTRRLR